MDEPLLPKRLCSHPFYLETKYARGDETAAHYRSGIGSVSGSATLGKLFSITQAQLQESYPRFEDFRTLAKKYDPKGQFRNAYLDLNLYA